MQAYVVSFSCGRPVEVVQGTHLIVGDWHDDNMKKGVTVGWR